MQKTALKLRGDGIGHDSQMLHPVSIYLYIIPLSTHRTDNFSMFIGCSEKQPLAN